MRISGRLVETMNAEKNAQYWELEKNIYYYIWRKRERVCGESHQSHTGGEDFVEQEEKSIWGKVME